MKNIYCACVLIGCLVMISAESNEINSRGIDAKSMLTSLASNLMSRGYSTTANGGSQVVSLNLTNLLVLVLLKALIFAAGSLGAGTWKGGYGRSADGTEQLLTEDEILLYLGYLTGTPGNNACLQNIACKQPGQASRYSSAGDMLLKATKMMSSGEDGGDASVDYAYTLQELKEAINFSLTGGDCDARYRCTNDANKLKK